MAGIYIHIPFCKKKCHYCDFYKTLDTGQADRLISSIKNEISKRGDYLPQDSIIDSIYFGGGTPSVLSVIQLRDILDAVTTYYIISPTAEITFEINPDDVNKTYLRDLRREGVNRLSIGIQSWNDNVLKMLNRRHNTEQGEKAVETARKEGYDNISVDLIYGIPGMTYDEWKEALNKTFKLGVEHISAYHLTLEDNTMFGKMRDLGELEEISEEESEKQFSLISTLASRYGYVHYEISNLCKEGYYSRHNTSYWQQVNYIGFGPSAHSYNGYSRQWNISDLGKYIDKLDRGEVYYEKEQLDEKERYNEYIMTSLRTIWGIDMSYVESSFDKEKHDYLLNLASRFIKYGMIVKSKTNKLVLTEQGKMISDNIISELMMS